jgi:hypothetical protein
MVMKKLTFLTAILFGCLVACGSPPEPKSPTEEPEFSGPGLSEESEGAESEGMESEGESEGSESEGSESEGEEAEEQESELPPEAPARQPCSALQKSRCQVTQGCAWYQKGRKGECVEE